MGKFTFAVATAMASTAAAFPAMLAEVGRGEANNAMKRAYVQSSGAGTVPDPASAVLFNAEEQYVSTTGQYAWVAPTETDQRGPCPGLNAAANHGYIPHDGIANIDQFVQGTNSAFGMGLDLATFLAVYGSLFDGNLDSWSIGGPDSRVSLGLLGLLNKPPTGISGSHNNYEADVSPTRGDLYQYGNAYLARPEQFAQLYAFQSNVSNDESNYNLEILQTFRSQRFQQSISENPYFFNAIFAGVAVQPAAYTFIYRFMANHTEEHPDGILTQDVLKSFFAMEGPDSNGAFTNTHGYERIPDNWYRRPLADAYTIPFFMTDLLQEASVYPEFLSVGGNTGTTNSFTGVNINDLTGGVYDISTLAEGNNLQCFVFQFLEQDGPDFLVGLLENAQEALSQLQQLVSNNTAGLNCPQLEKIQYDQFDKYPGFTKSGGMFR